jgi:hypothetical protein
MAYTAHHVRPSDMSDKISLKLKQICSAWTYLGRDEYVVHHSIMLNDVCPVCKLLKELK